MQSFPSIMGMEEDHGSQGGWKFSPQAELRNEVCFSSATGFLGLSDLGLVNRRQPLTREVGVVDVLTVVIKSFDRATWINDTIHPRSQYHHFVKENK